MARLRLLGAILALCFAFACDRTLHGEPLAGTCLDDVTGEPVAGAQVLVSYQLLNRVPFDPTRTRNVGYQRMTTYADGRFAFKKYKLLGWEWPGWKVWHADVTCVHRAYGWEPAMGDDPMNLSARLRRDDEQVEELRYHRRGSHTGPCPGNYADCIRNVYGSYWDRNK
jgi:hypothetical protein